MDFSVDGYNFATAGRDLSVRIYDTKTLRVRRLIAPTISFKDLHITKTVVTADMQHFFKLKYWINS